MISKLIQINSHDSTSNILLHNKPKQKKLYYEELIPDVSNIPILDSNKNYWKLIINNKQFYAIKGLHDKMSNITKKQMLHNYGRIYYICLIREPDNINPLLNLKYELSKIIESSDNSNFISNINYISLNSIFINNSKKYIDINSKKIILSLIQFTYSIFKLHKSSKVSDVICMSCNHIRTRTPSFIITYCILFEKQS